MELQNIFMILRKRIWILVLFTAVLAAAAGLVSFFVLKPEYKATSSLLVVKTENDDKAIEYSDILLNEKLASTYREIINSRLIISEVIRTLGLKMSPEELKEKVKVSLKKDTALIVIEVKNNNPKIAAAIAEQISTVFINNIKSFVNTDNVQLIDRAQVPSKPSSPSPVIIMLIAGVIGAFVGILSILINERMQNTLKAAADIEGNLSLSVLGIIPKDKWAKGSKKNHQDENAIFNSDDNSFYSEAYRSLRTNLQFCILNRKIKSIVITSPEPRDGKSTLVSNLAVKLSEAGYKVLLLDTDFRRPKIHEMFGLLNYRGITNILAENIDYKEAVNTLSPGYPDVLTSGPIPNNPSEILLSDGMKSLLKKLEQSYDIVLLDSPSAGLVSDAIILSSIANGVIIVYTSEKTKLELARNIKASFAKANINILGAVLNKVALKAMNYKNVYDNLYFNKLNVVPNKTNREESREKHVENEINKQQEFFEE